MRPLSDYACDGQQLSPDPERCLTCGENLVRRDPELKRWHGEGNCAWYLRDFKTRGGD